MKTIYKSTPQGFVVVNEVVRNSWTHIDHPEEAEVIFLRDTLAIPESFITASLDAGEIARFDREGDAVLLVVLIPHSHPQVDGVPFSTTPLGIVINDEHLVTICTGEDSLVQSFVARPSRSASTAKRNRLVLQIFLAVAQTYLRFLREIEARVDAIQARVQASLRNRELLELLRYQKSLIYFRTALESNSLMIRRLTRSGIFELYPEDADLFEDVLTENAQASAMTAISSDILNQMMDAYASIISNNVNDVLRVLALATIMLAVPTMIASLYGMNVPLPGQESEWAFEAILGTGAIGMGAIFAMFWRRRWL